mmetsp:Transcript_31089/g.58312  ORF Transcript_31089/g.58312 Transcript_31089/m.58312 type:complete len:248 (-) Transcript_31089:182-925(-)
MEPLLPIKVGWKSVAIAVLGMGVMELPTLMCSQVAAGWNWNTEPTPAPQVCNSWTAWSQCSVTCGEGTQSRTRTGSCSSYSESDMCFMDDCPPPCQDWQSWGTCSQTCGGGTRSRSRTGGCTSLTDSESCMATACPTTTASTAAATTATTEATSTTSTTSPEDQSSQTTGQGTPTTEANTSTTSDSMSPSESASTTDPPSTTEGGASQDVGPNSSNGDDFAPVVDSESSHLKVIAGPLTWLIMFLFV